MSETVENTELGSDEIDEPSTGSPIESPSTTSPLVKWSEAWWATRSPQVQAGRCKAHRSDGSGDRCGKAAMKGQRVCGSHGGKAKRSMDAAKRRIAESADPAAKQLLKLAFDEKQSADIRLKATLQLLDRAGVNTKTSVEVEVSPKPIAQVLDSITHKLETSSRAEYRRSQGIDDDSDRNPPAFAALRRGDHSEPIDVEILDVNGYAHPRTPRADERQPYGYTAPAMGDYGDSIDFATRLVGADPPVATDQAMTMEEANEAVAEMRRRAAERTRDDARADGRAVIHPAQRALPPGRSGR